MNGRHPPHLKGKEIGLYYARKQREKKEAAEEMAKDMLEISDDQIEKIEKLLGPKLVNLNSNFFDKKQSESEESEFLMAYHRNLALNKGQNSRLLKRDEIRTEVEEKNPVHMPRKIPSSPSTAFTEARSKLPAYAVRHKIIELVENHNVIVISGETGCGKTTQVPQFILEEFEGSRIVCTQPRRISAITVANRKIRRPKIEKVVGTF